MVYCQLVFEDMSCRYGYCLEGCRVNGRRTRSWLSQHINILEFRAILSAIYSQDWELIMSSSWPTLRWERPTLWHHVKKRPNPGEWRWSSRSGVTLAGQNLTCLLPENRHIVDFSSFWGMTIYLWGVMLWHTQDFRDYFRIPSFHSPPASPLRDSDWLGLLLVAPLWPHML